MSFELKLDEQGKLTLVRPGADDVADVRVRRAFPWSHRDGFISIRDPEGKELELIEDLSKVGAETRELIESYLSSSVFIPRITHIDAVDVRFGYQQWTVQTDRGAAEFRVQEREDIRFLPDGRFSVKDADGNVYEMPRLDQLDEHSRRAVEALV